MVNTLKKIFIEASSLNDYLNSRGINPKFVSRETKISHAKSAQFQKWKNDRKMAEETIVEASEAELLAKYLNSRGINPKFATKEQKIAHSKSGQFQKWKRDHQHLELGESVTSKHTPTELRAHALKKAEHMHKEIKSDGIHKKLHSEEVDKEDVISMDIPLLIRMLEYAREDAKTDMDLHKVTEKLIRIRSKGTLTMADYEFVTKLKEELQFDEAKTIQGTALDKFRQAAADRAKKHADIEKQSKEKPDMKGAIDRLEKHLNKEEVEQIDELKKDTLTSYRQKSMASLKNAKVNRAAAEPGKDMSKGFADLHAKSDAIVKKRAKGLAGYLQRKHGMKPGYEDERKTTSENTLDSMAATEAPCTCANEVPTNNKKEMSKSARIIKSIYKRLNMKEETYDHEKDDKSSEVKPYGKAPKINTLDKKGTLGDTKPEARVVMKGGTTLTGQPRDMVEIDPSMKQRPGQQDKGQNVFTSPTGKKSPSL